MSISMHYGDQVLKLDCSD